jgi:acyl carrier protein
MRSIELQPDYAASMMTTEKIKQIAAGIFQLDVSSIRLDMGPEDIDTWDSLNHLRLITEVESSFSVQLSMQQIQKIQSLSDLVNTVATVTG